MKRNVIYRRYPVLAEDNKNAQVPTSLVPEETVKVEGALTAMTSIAFRELSGRPGRKKGEGKIIELPTSTDCRKFENEAPANQVAPEEAAKARNALKKAEADTEVAWKEALLTVRELSRRLFRKGYICAQNGGFMCAFCGKPITARELKQHFDGEQVSQADIDELKAEAYKAYRRAALERNVDRFLEEPIDGEVVLVVGKILNKTLKRTVFELYRGRKVKLIPPRNAWRIAKLVELVLPNDRVTITEDKHYIQLSI